MKEAEEEEEGGGGNLSAKSLTRQVKSCSVVLEYVSGLHTRLWAVYTFVVCKQNKVNLKRHDQRVLKQGSSQPQSPQLVWHALQPSTWHVIFLDKRDSLEPGLLSRRKETTSTIISKAVQV